MDGYIYFKDVYFSYLFRFEVKIFDKLCLDILFGKIVVFVGGSGFGKSIVIFLIERFYELFVGKIFLDGVEIKELDFRWFR